MYRFSLNIYSEKPLNKGFGIVFAERERERETRDQSLYQRDTKNAVLFSNHAVAFFISVFNLKMMTPMKI